MKFERRIFTRAALCHCAILAVVVCLSVCLSVCPSVARQYSIKTAKLWITRAIPHDSLGTLVFLCQRSPLNLNGVTPNRSAKCRCGRVTSASFEKIICYNSKTVHDRCIVSNVGMHTLPVTLGNPNPETIPFL